MDPGNFLTDIQAGANFNYLLVWVIIGGTFLGLLLQVLCARLGIVTKTHLATMCRLEYGHHTFITLSLWLLTEVTIICSDIPEVIGSAFGLLILFKIPLWGGVLITSASTLVLLGIQYFGVRKLELFIGLLIAIMGVCFFVESAMAPVEWGTAHCLSTDEWCARVVGNVSDTSMSGNVSASNTTIVCPPNLCGNIWGGLFPRLTKDAIPIAVSLLGAVVMPHNLYLHSGLMQSRSIDTNSGIQVKWAIVYNIIESSVSLLISCFVNISILVVAASVFYPSKNNGWILVDGVDEIGFTSAKELLAKSLKEAAGILFGIALLASGISSTCTGTFAGQFVMEGFLDLRIEKWKRNLLTRSVAIVPSLLVVILVGEGGANTLIIISSIVLSFQLPFAMIPLLKFTSSSCVMGPHKNSFFLSICCSVFAGVIIIANISLIILIIFQSSFSRAITILLGIFVSISIIFYLSLLVYLVWRPLHILSNPSNELEFNEMRDIELDLQLQGTAPLLNGQVLSEIENDIDSDEEDTMFPIASDLNDRNRLLTSIY